MKKPVGALPFAISPATGNPALPLSFGQLLDRIYALTRANLRLFLEITTIPAVIYILCCAPLTVTWVVLVLPWQSGQHPTLTRRGDWLLAVDVVCILLIVLFFPLYEAAACYAAVQANAGARVTPGEAWRITWKNAGRYLWLTILRALVGFGPMIAAGAAAEGAIVLLQMRISRGENGDVAFILLGIVMLVYLAAGIYAVLMSVRMALVYPASVVDNLTAWRSIVRSNRVARGAGLRIWLATFLMFAITYAIWLAVALVILTFTLIGVWMIAAFHVRMEPWGYLWIGVLGLIFLLSVFFWIAFYWTAFETCATVLYHDQLLRKEGLAPAPVRLQERPA